MILGMIVDWYIKRQAKQNPDKNVRQIIEEFLRDNGLQADITIDNDVQHVFVSKSQKEKMLAKFDKLSDIKKQQVIRDIENKSGISLDSIENQIITGENISVGLHEAGHLKDMQHGENLKLMARKWAPKLSYGASIYGAASNSAAAKLIRKGTLPLMIAGQLPALIQEFKASNTAYQEIKKQLGEDEANKRLVKELAPMFASHVSGSIIEPYILSQILGIAVKKMLANLMAKRAEEQASLEVFEKTATQILEDLL